MSYFYLFRYVFLLVGLITASYGQLFEDLSVAFYSVLFVFAHNLLYGIEKLKSRIIFLFFNITFFVFLISRLFVVEVFGYRELDRGLLGTNFTDADILFKVLSILFISLVCLWLGFLTLERLTGLRTYGAKPNKLLMKISFVFLVVCFILKLMFWFEAIIAARSMGYFAYFSNFKSSLPQIVVVLGKMFPVAFFLFLASNPKSKYLIIPIFFYLFEGVFSIGTGTRSVFMLNTLIVIIYLISRSIIGKRSLLAIGVLMPVIIMFLGLVEQLRNKYGVVTTSASERVLEFFYAQGVSVNLLGYVQSLSDSIPEKYYVLGPFAEFFMTKIWWPLNGKSVELFGQTVERALEGFQFSHTISYLIMPDLYLKGVGYGSSYIAEWYHDFGWAGVFIGNFGLGLLLYALTKMLYGRSLVLVFLSLLMTRMMFFVPRASSVAFLIDAFSPINLFAMFLIGFSVLVFAPYCKRS
ncbi:O-antigen polysaccharide polymerase Wzy family protein [Oligella urethralis]|uniref:O-antigen polysaccharide polymerase Wzy family protein n=1 Tax=Oligella urethralis TaxID=90245 RepID=UPI000DFF550A|nr:O-antigen polysaccharide polymerase Wzy family protein [Oligella urethralis]SUA57969.1 Uncharacterised protein [Oligella urethralis]